MASVDDRIVRMEFDNASFERKVGNTITSLGQLEKALKFDGAKQGFADLSSMAEKFHLGGMGTVIDGISTKFLALSTIAITALANITNKAIDAGIQMAKSLSLDQIISGFKEYEQNMGSIQTILANTKADGTNLEQVNAALDELNEYSDKTIYNFGQMTKNIGTFTAAGVDLDTSVQSIKGISNLAAISGSSAEQASTAMYQLSQAVSTGTLRLQDWNSVVNAGMGGEVFQKALFETGKTLGTIKDVPIDQTFQEWTDAGNSFRGSLQDGWLTSEVLTTTLQGFTGEMTEAQLTAIGYTKEQAAEILELGKTGVEAATKIRTLTQFIETTKEAIGSGWSESFRIVIGNFEEATALWGHFGSQVGDFVKKNADARNELLQGWKDLGGRDTLIYGLQIAIDNLGRIIAPIKEAFREIFPPATAQTLFDLTQRFYDFAVALEPSAETVDNLKRIFKGFFGALEIGWEVVKQTAQFIGDLIQEVTGAGSGQFLDFAASIGDFFTDANDSLVKGGGIKDFFTELKDLVKDPIPFIKELKDKIVEFFDNIDVGDILDNVGDKFGRLGDRFESLKEIFKKAQEIWRPIENAFKKVGEFLDKIWEQLKTFFSELGDKLADAFSAGDFDKVMDVLNVGLLGGIILLLKKFLDQGLKIDFGGGFMESMKDSFQELTGIFSAMQTNLKADALMKIAIAIGILTASVVALSLIDSSALTKALTAMSVGFGQLMAVFAILAKLEVSPKSAASFTLLAVGMSAMAGSMLLLAGAAKVLASLSWEELARGLTGVLALMAIMTTAALILSQNTSGLVRAGIGMIGIAIALNILAGAVKIFATMSWSELAQGFTAVAVGLGMIAVGMRLMPKGLALQAVGLLAIAVSLNILALAMKAFATMDWGEMGKGMVGIGGGLLLIAGAMQLMPPTMPLIGAGLLLVSVSLIAIAKAMAMIGELSWGEIAKGLVAMAGALLILAVASNAMSGAIVGAIAIGIISVSLLALTEVIKQMAGISWGDLLHGLIGIAAVLATLAIAAMLIQPAIPAMFLLGAALLVIGAGFALFGLGASLVAEAFMLLADAGKEGSEALVDSLKAIGKALPSLVAGFAEGIVELIKIIGEAAPEIVEALGKILSALIDKLGELIPKLIELVGELITALLEFITTKYPEIVQAGIDLIMSLLEGIRDNIDEVVTVVGEIITEFLDALSQQLVNIVQEVADLITEFFTAVADAAGRVAGTMMVGVGITFLKGFMSGITQAAPGPMKWFTDLAKKVLGWIGNVAKTLWNKGIDFISGLFGGIVNKATSVITWFQQLAGKVLGWIGNVARTLWNKGIDFITGLLNGINNKIGSVSSFFSGLVGKVLTWIGNTFSSLWSKGWGLIAGLYDGIIDKWSSVTSWFGNIGTKVKNAVGDLGRILYNAGKAVITGFLDGLKSAWDATAGWLGDRAGDIASLKGPPTKDAVILVENGMLIMQGLQKGMEDEWETVAQWLSEVDPAAAMDNNMGDRMATVLNGAITDMVDQLGTMDEFNPVITPVLDLTRVAEDAKQIPAYLPTDVSPTYSTSQAQVIARATAVQTEDIGPIKDPAGSGEVKFEQNIYAPAQLSTADIYKQTRNQITMAKEELSIP